MSDERMIGTMDLDGIYDKLTEESASLEGCIRESTNRIVAALLVNAKGNTTERIEAYELILRGLEGGK